MWTPPLPANCMMEASTIQKQLSRFSWGLQMLSDHLLILSCAVLFKMYLLCSYARTPNTTHDIQSLSQKCHSSNSKQKNALKGTICLLHCGILTQKLDLMRKHLSLSVKQQAILGTVPIVDSSIWRSQWCCSHVRIRAIGSSTVAQSSAYAQQRGLGDRVLERCLPSAQL